MLPKRSSSRCPWVSPGAAGRSSGIAHMPAFTRLMFRPEPPKPISAPSSTATEAPLSARCRAADRPVKPAPTTATSASVSRPSGAVAGGGGAESSQQPVDEVGLA